MIVRILGWRLVPIVVILSIVAVVLEIIVVACIGEPIVFPCIVVSLVLCLLCSTPWAIASYAVMAVYVFRNSGVKRLQFSLAQLLAVVTWLAAYLGAWRTSFIWMLQEYAKLPTTPSEHCYVCTAAARGHRRLVGAEEYTAPDGTIHRVNDQMRYLKAAELLLASTSPPVHRVARRVYDRIGPILAAGLVHPLLGDVVYLSLKPPEWLSRAGLALVLPGRRPLIRRIYRPAESGRS